MSIQIIEFKAAIPDIAAAEIKLQTLSPFFKGEDHQVDTYFNTTRGRLKLREGDIESALIWYDRPNDAGNKLSNVLLYKPNPGTDLKNILTQSNGIKVKGLGQFIEVEAIDEDGSLGVDHIKAQCEHYARFFEIEQQQYISHSYSDLIIEKNI
jgi:adenylate cyclase class 2